MGEPLNRRVDGTNNVGE